MKRFKYNITVFLSVIGFAALGISCGANREYTPASLDVAKDYRFADTLASVDNS